MEKETTKRRLQELCEAAAKEHDPQKLFLLTEEINRLLEKNDEQLEQRDTSAA